MPIFPAGYYNEFNPATNYTEVLALAGFVEQSREDNEMQSILKNVIKTGFDTLYKNGELVSGGELISLSSANAFALNAAKVYLNGIVFNVPAASITLTGIGIETIGVTLTTTVVTASMDTSLTDPATGYPNAGQPGAARLHQVCAWTLSDPTAAVLYTFNNGIQQTQPVVGNVDVVTPALARRTYDEAGDFVVAGFDMTAAAFSTQQLQVVVNNKSASSSYNGSKAYVQGNEIIKIIADSIAVDRPLDTRNVLGQQFTYLNAGATTFAFPSQPVIVGGVDQVLATFDEIRTVTSHNYNGYDELIVTGETLVNVICAYHSGTPASPVTEYVLAASQTGTGDYYQSGNGIRWDVAGSSTDPVASGDTYYVYCTVSRLVPANQYTVTTTGGVSYLNIGGMTQKPYSYNQATSAAVIGLNMEVNYHFQLSRIDAIFLNPDGTLGLSKGTPEVKPAPPLTPGGVLGLGQILLPAGCDYDKAVITQYATKRLTMADLQKILTRVQDAEYNIAKTDLDSRAQVRAGNSITTLKGILTESFTYSATDIQNDGVGGISLVKFVADKMTGPMIDVTNRQLVLPLTTTPWTLSNPSGSAHISKANMTLPYTVSVMAQPSQLQATEAIPVNKYGSPGDPPLYQNLVLIPPGDSTPEVDTTTLASIDPTSALLLATNFFQDNLTSNTVPTAQSNVVGFLQSADLYVADQWIYVKGTGFTPGAQLDVRIDGLLPRAYTVSPTSTVLPITGTPILRKAQTTAVSNPVTFSASFPPDSNGIYTTDGYGALGAPMPSVPASGTTFDFYMRVPALLRSGNKTITVRTGFGDSASQVFVAAATNTLEIVAPAAQVATVAAATTPTSVPVTSNVVVRNRSNGAPLSSLSITTPTQLEFLITWDASSGAPPTDVWVTPDLDAAGHQRRLPVPTKVQSGTLLGTYTVGGAPEDITIDSQKNIWICNGASSSVTKLSPTGTLIATYTVGSGPEQIVFDGAGNGWVACTNGNVVTKITNASMPVITSYAVGNHPYSLAVDNSGNIWVPNSGSNNVSVVNGSTGAVMNTYAVGNGPDAIAIDASGNVWIANETDNTVTKLSSAGSVLATYAVGTTPSHIRIDQGGNAWVANEVTNNVTRISSTGTISTYASGGTKPLKLEIDALNNIWVTNWSSNTVTKLAGQANGPTAMGTVLQTITLPGSTSGCSGLALDDAGSIWVTSYNTATVNKYSVQEGNAILYSLYAPTKAATNYTVHMMGTNGPALSTPVAISYGGVAPTAPTIPGLDAPIFTIDTGSVSSGKLTYSGLTGIGNQLIVTAVSAARLAARANDNTISAYNYYSTTTDAFSQVIASPGTAGSVSFSNCMSGETVFMVEVINSLGNNLQTVTQNFSALTDPVAETFNVPTDCFIEGIDLYFKAKPTDKPITVEIRNVTNGYPGGPGTTVASSAVASATLLPASINIPTTADNPVATYFQFNDSQGNATPVFLQGGIQYAIVVTTDSPTYQIYVATVGNNLLPLASPPVLMPTQAYSDGVLFVSANSATWSAVQASDLMFQLHQAVFTPDSDPLSSGTIVTFDPISNTSGLNMVGLYLPLDTLLPTGSSTTPPTSVIYEYQVDSALGTWRAIVPNTYEFFDVAANSQVNIRARMKTTLKNLTPVIDCRTNLKVNTLYRGLAGIYVTKTATYTEAYRNVTMIADEDLTGTGTSARWYVSDNTPYTTTVPAYDNAHTYAIGDLMQNPDGSQWQANASTVGHTAPNTSYWNPIKVDMSVIWHELVAAGETITALSDGIFQEHERTIDLGADGSRFQFRFRLELAVNSVANSIYTPKVRDVITICNS